MEQIVVTLAVSIALLAPGGLLVWSGVSRL